jgi:hypothetical protein
MIVIGLQETIFLRKFKIFKTFTRKFFFNNPNFSISESPDFHLKPHFKNPKFFLEIFLVENFSR